ncbi:hypothetical protein [Kocuria sp.]|uniref:hypothetical protein n=1 Tax=Kocuria sp. TaxID=1871328 RepID=UPI0026DB3AB0|nr:hypothetical protein [Kocuria sp.]MDO4919291.1 hypothetical protein [Kocuria sp.]
MSEYPRDEFDDVPEDGSRQGAHRGHNPRARTGSRGQLRAVLAAGVLSLVLGAFCFVNAPRTAQDTRAHAAPAAAAETLAGGVVAPPAPVRSAGNET